MTHAAVKEVQSRMVAATPTDSAHFFGFYDLCPWSPDDDRLVVLACDPHLSRTPRGEIARVCVWNPQSGDLGPIAETTGWNFQHGARTQWLKDGTILFNDVGQGRQCAHVVDTGGRRLRTIPTSVAALHPDETYGVTPNYARLAVLYPAYGYHAASNAEIDQNNPDRDGLWRVDMATGAVSLLLSFSRLCDLLKISFSPQLFVTHPVFSPSGAKICFFAIENRGDGGQFMWLLVYEPATDALTVINSDKNSHPTWLDDEQLMVWARCSSAVSLLRRSGILSIPGARALARMVRQWQGASRNSALSEGFYIFNAADPSKRSIVSPEAFTEDGHPSKHPVRDVVLCDTYPDASGYLSLFLYSLGARRRIDIARVFHGVRTADIDMRCDLHPRWNRRGDRVSVDYSENGVRRCAVFDATEALALL